MSLSRSKTNRIDSSIVGWLEGAPLGAAVDWTGEKVGTAEVGVLDGEIDGVTVGVSVGLEDGRVVIGANDGLAVGDWIGEVVGSNVEGLRVGTDVVGI